MLTSVAVHLGSRAAERLSERARIHLVKKAVQDHRAKPFHLGAQSIHSRQDLNRLGYAQRERERFVDYGHQIDPSIGTDSSGSPLSLSAHGNIRVTRMMQ